MNIHELRDAPHLSVSSINDYIDCGLLYRFGRIEHVMPDFEIDALKFGITIHSVLGNFYREKMIGNKQSLETMISDFEKCWRAEAEGKDIKYKEGDDFETLLKKGKTLLTTYYNNLPDDDFDVIGIEEPFSFTIDGLPPVIGIIDLIEEDDSGTIIITDFKTSSKAYSTDEIDNSLQLTIYNMAAKSNGYADREILLRFDVLIKTKVPKFEQYYTTRSEDDEKRVIKKVNQVWEGIQKGVFIPNDTSWKCKGCVYKTHCDKWFRR